MSVSITFSINQGGSSISDLNHDNIDNGAQGATQHVYIRHDGDNEITSCTLYMQAYTGSYVGGASAADDYNELIAWGDAWAAAGDGGFEINQDLVGGFQDSNWVVHKTGQGTSAVPIPLDGDCIVGGPGTDGEIGSGEDAHVQLRVNIPAGEDTAGIRQFDQVFGFTFTS